MDKIAMNASDERDLNIRRIMSPLLSQPVSRLVDENAAEKTFRFGAIYANLQQ
jgi:hypothetical protein